MVTAYSQRSIDHHRPMKVIVMGAGISGILAGIRLPQHIQNLELVIYEKNPDIGGTWLENRYPGVACDLPSHSYQLTFEPNPAWEQFYAKGSEILKYWKGITNKYNLYEKIKLNSKVIHAQYDEAACKWNLKILNTGTGEVLDDSADVLYTCPGALNHWEWPDIAGLHDFKGKLMHSADWDDDWVPDNKTVAVIGAGSSAIQIIPAIQANVKNLYNFIRGEIWIAPPFAASEVEKHSAEANFCFSDEEINSFQRNPDALLAYRKAIEEELQSFHHVTHQGESSKAAQAHFQATMTEKLRAKPEILQKILPDFPPGCRRLTPGPGYLKSLTESNVHLIKGDISHVTTDGIVLNDGTHYQVDTIVCATGFVTNWVPRFPIIGKNGINLQEKWAKYPDSYLSVATDRFPNMFIAHGPNSAVSTGNLIIVLEQVAEYVGLVVAKMQRDAIKTIEVRESAVKAFSNYCAAYFPKTVFSLNCRSWYKSGTKDGRISALWPGSSLHAMEALRHPRWEDYEYEYLDDNPASWLGDGWTEAGRTDGASRSYYLDDERISYLLKNRV